jgi:hypothetical protein
VAEQDGVRERESFVYLRKQKAFRLRRLISSELLKHRMYIRVFFYHLATH